MKNYEFDVILKNLTEVTDELADALFESGCDDGTPAGRNGVAWVHFDRSANSLEEAIRSAVLQIQTAGLSVERIEMSAVAAASLAP